MFLKNFSLPLKLTFWAGLLLLLTRAPEESEQVDSYRSSSSGASFTNGGVSVHRVSSGQRGFVKACQSPSRVTDEEGCGWEGSHVPAAAHWAGAEMAHSPDLTLSPWLAVTM